MSAPALSRKGALVLAAWMVLAGAALALDPSEMLDDPALEARARALDNALRCVRCQSESLASSNADWARDARRALREQIAQGASDQEVKDWFVARYGEFVLMDPPKTGWNLALWLAPVGLLGFGLIAVAGLYRRQGGASETAALSEAEEARLKELMED